MAGNKNNNNTQPGLLGMADHAPWIIEFVNNNPWAAQILAILAGYIFKNGKVEFPEISAEDQTAIAGKAERKLGPSGAAAAFDQGLGKPSEGPAEKISIRYDGAKQNTLLTLKTSTEDKDTGFKGAVYMDENGHAVVLLGGLDLTNPDSGDMRAIVQARLFNQVNDQTGPAQDLYLQAAKMSKSVEIVGYSMGGMLAEDMAARLGAKATTIADIGLPDVKGSDGKSLYTSEHIKNIRDNVVALQLPGDKFIASAGTVHARSINLSSVSGHEVVAAMQGASLEVNFNAQNSVAIHHPAAYAFAAQKLEPREETPVIASAPSSPGISPGKKS